MEFTQVLQTLPQRALKTIDVDEAPTDILFEDCAEIAQEEEEGVTIGLDSPSIIKLELTELMYDAVMLRVNEFNTKEVIWRDPAEVTFTEPRL